MTDKLHRPTIICTAGHIDHGKSSSVFSLTGISPDTLDEEMAHETSVRIGFTKYGSDVLFADVPGHEKLIKSMLVGASVADAALLVVAADDGVMPQTREHFEALQLLGVKSGVIALTKIDLSEKDWIELVRRDIRALVAGSPLQAVAIVPISNRSGEGIAELKQELDLMIRGVNPRRDHGLFRLWVDRSFTVKGIGTVVSGTVLSGRLKVDDRVELLPAKVYSRVKQIEIHKEEVESIQMGERVELHLPGVDKEAVQQGDLAATPDHYQPTFIINAHLNLLQTAPRNIEDRMRFRLHLGSSEHTCRVALLDRAQITPGSSGYVQFRLDEPCMTDLGDRLVIRSHSEGRLIGGGIVLEVHPPKMKATTQEVISRLARLESGQPTETVRLLVRRKGLLGSDAVSIARETSLLESEALDVLAALHRDGEVIQIASAPKWSVVDRLAWNHLRERVVVWLSEYHASLPQMTGARRSETKARAAPSASAVVLDRVIESLVEEGLVTLEGDLIRLTSHQTSLAATPVALGEQIADIYLKSRFIPPAPKQIALELEKTLQEVQTALAELAANGEIVILSDPDGGAVYYHQEAVDEARLILIDLLTGQSEIRFFEYREKLGSTRKYTTPLANLFDREGLTYRDGEVRKRGVNFPVLSNT